VLSMSWSLTRASGRGPKRRRSRFLYGLIPDSHPASRVAGERRPGGARPKCRVCGTPLFGTTATKLLRCDDCPSDVDLELLDRLKQWRSAAAKAQDVPGFVVLTDATLTAIAEQRPAGPSALVGIPGIGAAKLDRYGDDVLRVLAEHASEGSRPPLR
jgi:DNA helicase-2/ATP-dependent DNA helicase PcrA